jgi:hypothetical protein
MIANDRAALKECFAIASRDPEMAEYLRDKVKREGWQDAATFACFGVQRRSLRLRPWQAPPCHCDENDPKESDRTGQLLLQNMLAVGVSRYSPDPVRELKQRKRKT